MEDQHTAGTEYYGRSVYSRHQTPWQISIQQVLNTMEDQYTADTE